MLIFIFAALFTNALASIADRTESLRLWKDIRATFGTDMETVEVVSKILEDFESFEGILPLSKCTQPEVCELILSKTKGQDADRRALELAKVISDFLKELSDDEAEDKIIRMCLGELANCQWQPFKAVKLIIRPKEILGVFTKKEMVYLEDHFPVEFTAFLNVAFDGIDFDHISHEHLKFFPILMEYPQFTPDKFKAALGASLPLKFCSKDFTLMNWMEVALMGGRLDLAEIAFHKGLRVSQASKEKDKDGTFERNVDKFVQRLALDKMKQQHAPLYASIVSAGPSATSDVYKGALFPKVFQLLKAQFEKEIYEAQPENLRGFRRV